MQNTSFLTRLTKGIRARAGGLFSNPYRQVNISWLDEKYYKHLPSGKIRSHTLFGKKMHFTNPAEYLHGLKEMFIDDLYKQELPERPYIIDCGANIGLSIIYMKQLYPKAEILAFEPDVKNFELLTANIRSFGYDEVTLRKEAVWIQDTVLYFSSRGSSDSKIENTRTADTIEVTAVRLKDLLTRKTDFLKIDIEGAEFAVLQDIADNLGMVENLFIEYHGLFGQNNELTQILQLIGQKGFNYYIKEAISAYRAPFLKIRTPGLFYDLQLNIFCFRA
jgi:FkbM family methyltransferase